MVLAWWSTAGALPTAAKPVTGMGSVGTRTRAAVRDECWSCLVVPPISHLDVAVRGGERFPGKVGAMPSVDDIDRPRRRRVTRRVAITSAVLIVVALLPVPWRLQLGDDPLALAWHLDGRLEVDGQLLDPPGTWSWLTVGRPPLVGEVVVDVLNGGDMLSWDIRDGDPSSRPAMVEPVAAAVGLREAGIDVVPGEVDAVLFGNLPDLAPIDWARRHLALGPSHGLMVGLTTWAAAREIALEGVQVAGTGGLRPDGSVTQIGGLEAKARAARDDGADVMFFPLSQASELDGFAAGTMRLVGVDHFTEAVATLEHLAGPDHH